MRLATSLDERGTEHLVPAQQLPRGALESGHVQGAVDAIGERQVVDRRAGLKAVEEPQPLLGGGEREVRTIRRGLDRVGRGQGLPAFSQSPDSRSQSRDRRRREQRTQGQLDAERRPDVGDHAGSQQGVTAQLEEVVLWAGSSACPSTSAQIPASSSARGSASPREGTGASDSRLSGAGRALRSTLPFGVSGSRSSRMNEAGTMNSASRPRR